MVGCRSTCSKHVACSSESRPDEKLGKAIGEFPLTEVLSSDEFVVIEKDNWVD